MSDQALARAVAEWYDGAARPLPWRHPGATAWAILVSEVMLQQTPVARVLPVYEAWLDRWPDPPALATASPAEVVREWGRLGYPRRALRLQQAARVLVERYGGSVPTDLTELLALPGVGTYTARAVAVFALGQRHPVVDTNVRRVVARAVEGCADAPVTRSALALVDSLLPADVRRAAIASAALMELGALVCTSRRPRCALCPLRERCCWLARGAPPSALRRPAQAYAGTDRQARGRILALLQQATEPIADVDIAAVWDEPTQRVRALDSLLADGLAVALGDGRYALPA
ncbi:MAG TPA: A/G-specific adenine glycosylase [Mycobacteriales bacterium]|nr:A/G-specific adenine glycosylase [Mycobacteriales bacterium]